jgi:hypothetical protein
MREPHPAGDVTLTRVEAKNRFSIGDRDGYVKTYTLIKNEPVDRQNILSFNILKTTVKDAPENNETKGHVRTHIYDGNGMGEVNAWYITGRNGFYTRFGLEEEKFEFATNIYTLAESPGAATPREECLGQFLTFDMGPELGWGRTPVSIRLGCSNLCYVMF